MANIYEPEYGSPAPPPAPPRNNTLIIIAVIVAILLCCCCIFLAAAWFFGDYAVLFLEEFLNQMGLALPAFM